MPAPGLDHMGLPQRGIHRHFLGSPPGEPPAPVGRDGLKGRRLADLEPVGPPGGSKGRDDSIIVECARGGLQQPVKMRLRPFRIGFVAENGGSEHAGTDGGDGRGLRSLNRI